MYRTLCSAFIVAGLWLSAGQAQAYLVTFDDLTPSNDSTEVVEIGGVNYLRTIRNGAYTTLPLLVGGEGGITVEIYRYYGAAFDLIDNTLPTQPSKAVNVADPGDPPVWEDHFGAVSLDPFINTVNDPFVITFSQPVRTVSFMMGDYGRDEDTMTAYAFIPQTPDIDTDVPAAAMIDFLPLKAPNDYSWNERRFTLTHSEGFQSVVFAAGGGEGDDADFDVYIDRIFFALSELSQPEIDDFPETLDDPENQGDDTTILPEPYSLTLLGLGGMAMLKRRRKSA